VPNAIACQELTPCQRAQGVAAAARTHPPVGQDEARQQQHAPTCWPRCRSSSSCTHPPVGQDEARQQQHAPTCWPRCRSSSSCTHPPVGQDEARRGLTTMHQTFMRETGRVHSRSLHKTQCPRTDLRGVLQHLITCSQEPQDEGRAPSCTSRHHSRIHTGGPAEMLDLHTPVHTHRS
jgi:hypothetical protein